MSNHLRTLTRRNLILGGIAVVLAIILMVRDDGTTSVDRSALPLAFPGFNAESVRRVELRQPGAGDAAAKSIRLELTSGGGAWTLASHHDYPTQAGASRLLDAIAGARLRGEITKRKETFAKYADDSGWIDVTLTDLQGAETLSFGIGRYAYPETFLRLGSGDDQRVVKVLNLSPGAARVDAGSWIETRIWPGLTASDAIRIDVEQREDKRVLSFIKRGQEAADVETESPALIESQPDKIWWMATPDVGDAKKLAVEDLVRAFTGVLIEDVVAGDASGADAATYGLDEPTTVVRLWTLPEGGSVEKSTLVVGKRVEGKEQWYARREGARWVFTVNATSLGRMHQMPADFRAPVEDVVMPGKGLPPVKGVPPKKDGVAPKKADAEPKKGK